MSWVSYRWATQQVLGEDSRLRQAVEMTTAFRYEDCPQFEFNKYLHLMRNQSVRLFALKFVRTSGSGSFVCCFTWTEWGDDWTLLAFSTRHGKVDIVSGASRQAIYPLANE